METQAPFKVPTTNSVDIEANRAGRITERQRWRQAALPLAGHVIGLCILAANAAAAAANGAWPLGLLLTAFWLFIAYAGVRLLLDLIEGRVSAAEGVLWRHIARDSEGDEYYVLVGGRKLKAGKSLFRSAVDGATYRVYFLPRSQLAVSLELITKPEGGAGCGATAS